MSTFFTVSQFEFLYPSVSVKITNESWISLFGSESLYAKSPSVLLDRTRARSGFFFFFFFFFSGIQMQLRLGDP
jgi:hypothetical protein